MDDQAAASQLYRAYAAWPLWNEFLSMATHVVDAQAEVRGQLVGMISYPTKCRGQKEVLGSIAICPLRHNCWRYTAAVKEPQDWLSPPPWKHDEGSSTPRCVMIWRKRNQPKEKGNELPG